MGLRDKILKRESDDDFSHNTERFESSNGTVSESERKTLKVNPPHLINPPFPAYEGNEAYIYASYKHCDYKLVYPVLEKLHKAGVNIWYDSDYKKNYDIDAATHIQNSALFVTFITEEVMKCSTDADDYLIKEMNVATHLKKETLPIYLEDVELSGYYLMHYLSKQPIFKFNYNEEEIFIEECINTFKDFGIKSKADYSDKSTPEKAVSERPFKAYEGDKPFIFISYKHADTDLIIPIIRQFHERGYNVWFDHGLKYGEDYDDLIDFKIEESSLFVIFITETVIEKVYEPDEYMKKELDVAIITGTKIFPIFLHPVGLKGKYRMQLQGKHSIFMHEYDNKEEFIDKCTDAFRDNFGIEPSI